MAGFKEMKQECPPFCNPFCTLRQIWCRLGPVPKIERE
jgi:hypothetical protein